MNYLYVCLQGAVVCYEDYRIVVKKNQNILKSVPIESLQTIELYGAVQISAKAIHECMHRNISVGIFSLSGFYIGKVCSSDKDARPKLIMAQIGRTGDKRFCMKWTKSVMA